MRNRSVKVALVCLFAIGAMLMSCAKAPPTQTGNCRAPQLELANVQLLGCWIDGNHLLEVGNATATPIPKGTTISFTAKLVNAGTYCGTVTSSEPIPPHLFIAFTGQPLFDDQAPCQAWRQVPPVLTQ
jgi:hypothetical protein